MTFLLTTPILIVMITPIVDIIFFLFFTYMNVGELVVTGWVGLMFILKNNVSVWLAFYYDVLMWESGVTFTEFISYTISHDINNQISSKAIISIYICSNWLDDYEQMRFGLIKKMLMLSTLLQSIFVYRVITNVLVTMMTIWPYIYLYAGLGFITFGVLGGIIETDLFETKNGTNTKEVIEIQLLRAKLDDLEKTSTHTTDINNNIDVIKSSIMTLENIVESQKNNRHFMENMRSLSEFQIGSLLLKMIILFYNYTLILNMAGLSLYGFWLNQGYVDSLKLSANLRPGVLDWSVSTINDLTCLL